MCEEYDDVSIHL